MNQITGNRNDNVVTFHTKDLSPVLSMTVLEAMWFMAELAQVLAFMTSGDLMTSGALLESHEL